MKILKEATEEVQLFEYSTVEVMERYILEFVQSNLAELIREEMEAEYVRFAEAKCNYAATISSLQDELAKCQSTIEKLLLQIK